MTTARRLLATLTALLLPALVLTAPGAAATAQPGGSLFTPLPDLRPAAGTQASVRPTAFRGYRVDLAAVRAQLAGHGVRTLAIPAPNGHAVPFRVAEAPVLDAAGQAAYPQIRTYAGHGPDGSSIRLDVTPLGFHAMVRRADGVAWYVDPVQDRPVEDRVLSYVGSAVPPAGSPFVEGDLRHPAGSAAASTGFAPAPGGVVSTRTYRLAFLNDPTYATHFGSTDVNVLAAKTSLVNRVNEVYNDDLAVHFTLDSNPRLNLDTDAEATGPDGPCGANACFTADQLAGCDSSTLDRNEFVLGQLVGADTFDIGHIGLGVNGGGIAGLGVVGGPYKADGCTGLPVPDGDFYAIDYVAHEMGHQMGGDHTFNGTQTNCSTGNRNTTPYATQVEPGSGSSIMAYAGICSSDNLQPHSDPYFSFASVDQINATAAAAPTNENEEQVVSFSGLDTGEQFTLSCAACPTSATVTFGPNPAYALALTTAVQAVTGQVGTVSGYDGALAPDAAGFTVDWNVSTADIPTLTVQSVSGTFTSFTGTVYNGGPTDAQGTVAPTANHSPVVTAPADKTIPVRTPFTLTGSATDADAGDTLIYLWEQTDAGGLNGTGLVDDNKTNGPLFRQFGTAAQVSAADTVVFHSPGENLAGTSPSRTFPDLDQILAGNTNAASGTCPAPAAPGTVPVTDPALDCFSEFLPTASWIGLPTAPRVMHFRLTARDEFTPDVAGDHEGGLSADDVALTVDPSAGPFLVTSRAVAGSPASGAEAVTWDVAGTDAASLAPEVRISLSTDGGLTYPTVLASSTPNDGSETLLLPSVTTSTARIKVEAVANYFFDVNDADFSIVPAPGGNQAPLVNAGPDRSVAVGALFSSSGTFSDETPATAMATVDYGDGAGPQPLPLTGTTFTLHHTYSTAGTRTVTVKVTDAGALSGTDTASVKVLSQALAAPTVKARAKPRRPVVGRAFKVKATVSASTGAPSGVVQVHRGGKLLGTGTLVNGKVTIKVSRKKARKLALGRNTLTATYLGSSTVAPGGVDFVVRLRKRR